jgi:hypothetical protein
MWGVTAEYPVERVLSDKGRFSRWVALYLAGDLRGQGLEIIPSGKEPHYDATAQSVDAGAFSSVRITATSAGDLVDRFLAAAYTGLQNEHFTPRPA